MRDTFVGWLTDDGSSGWTKERVGEKNEISQEAKLCTSAKSIENICSAQLTINVF